jgi:hypothetical protein
MIPSIIIGFYTPSTSIIYACTWATLILAFLALIVDYFHCQHRWSAGLLAVWPKLIPVTFLIMSAGQLGLLYGGALTPEHLRVWGGPICFGAFFVAVAGSLLVGKPFVYAYAVETLPDKAVHYITTVERYKLAFENIMWDLTILWAMIFLVLLALQIVCVYLKDSGNDAFASILGNVAPLIIVFGATKLAQPKVMEHAKIRTYQNLYDVDAEQARAIKEFFVQNPDATDYPGLADAA